MHRSCAPSSTPTTPSPRKSATPPTARTSAIAWSPARARSSLLPTPASPTTSRPCSSPPTRAPKKSTTVPCSMPGPQKTNSSIAACLPKSLSTFSPTPNPSVSTNPARFSISSTNGSCAPASTPRKKSTRPPWTNSPNSAKSTPNSRATSARPAISAPASPLLSAPKAPTSAASKSGSTSPTSLAASSFIARNHATIVTGLIIGEMLLMLSSFRLCLSILTAALLPSPSFFAFDTPLSDQAVREAYFLGQRHDESMARLLSRYTMFLPPPSTGPHIYAVTLLTPFALLVQHSSRQSNYSAQQAAKDHHADDEFVSISIEILLTQSYGALIAGPT